MSRSGVLAILRVAVAAMAGLAMVIATALIVVLVADEEARTQQHETPAPYSGRPDATETDNELAIRWPGEVGDLTVSVLNGGYEAKLSHLEPGGYLVVHVALENTGASPLSYDRDQWTARTPLGLNVAAAVTTQADLGAGTLKPGQRIQGDVYFEVGATTGFSYVYFEPSDADRRLVWRLGTLAADDRPA